MVSGMVCFAGGQEEVHLGLLAIVEIVVTASGPVEFVVVASLDDQASFHYQNLVGTADGRETVGDHEGRAASHQEGETAPGSALRIRSRGWTGGFVKNQDPRVGQDGTGDGCTRWRWPPDSFTSPLADYLVA